MDSIPFCLQDCHVYLGQCKLNLFMYPAGQLAAATFIGLEFTTQKNGVQGEVIGLMHSGSPLWCPDTALTCCILYLWSLTSDPTHPLYTYKSGPHWYAVSSDHLTKHLHGVMTVLGPKFGVYTSDISTHSLCSNNAMALLCANLDPDIIWLLGHW